MDVMQEMAYRYQIHDVNELHNRIVEAWEEMDQRVIAASIKQWLWLLDSYTHRSVFAHSTMNVCRLER